MWLRIAIPMILKIFIMTSEQHTTAHFDIAKYEHYDTKLISRRLDQGASLSINFKFLFELTPYIRISWSRL